MLYHRSDRSFSTLPTVEPRLHHTTRYLVSNTGLGGMRSGRFQLGVLKRTWYVPVWACHVRTMTSGFTFIFFGRRSTTCFSYHVYMYHFCFVLFFFSSPGTFFHSRVTRACPETTDLILRVSVRTTTASTTTGAGCTDVRYIPFVPYCRLGKACCEACPSRLVARVGGSFWRV